MHRHLIALGLGAALLALAAPAQAKHGVTPISPKRGDTVPVGERPTFKVKVRGKGPVWVHVCKSKRKDADGLICSDESIGQAKRSGGRHHYRPKFFDFPEFWLNSPGRYYWQAHRISCENGVGDCRLESKIIRFRVG